MHTRGTHLAVADDTGTVVVADLQAGGSVFKKLGRRHTNVCMAAQFRVSHRYDLVSGGLDAQVVHWDFFKARPLATVSAGSPSTAAAAGETGKEEEGGAEGSGNQWCNPPFVYALAVDPDDRGVAAALGNGTIARYAFDGDRGLRLDQTLAGGHTAIVNSVCHAGSDGRTLVSGGSDKRICVWRALDQGGDAQPVSKKAAKKQQKLQPLAPLALAATIDLPAKVNWLAAASDHVYAADTSAAISVWSLSS